MYKLVLFLLPFLFFGCSSDSSSDNTLSSRITDYPYSTDYDTSLEATKSNPMLVIRLDYPNQYFVNNESSWANKIFGTQTHQLNHYMNEVSNGQFQYSPVAEGGDENNGVITVYFATEHPDPNINYSTFESKLHPDLQDAITTVSNYGFNFSLYDDDHNGELTSNELLIVFIMAGEEDAYSGGGITNGVWAHEWCTSTQYTPFVNGVSVMGCDQNGNYAIFGERHYDFDSVSHDATIGIIAHELGHAALGLPDLYDTSGNTYISAGIGYFGLMSSGTWGQASSQEYPGQTPVHFSAWSKIYTGWYQPTIETGTDITLNGTGYSNYNIIKVPIDTAGKEYFLLENRTTTGYDNGLSYTLNGTYIGGVAIWHIDEDVISKNFDENTNTVNADVSHKGIDLEEADKAELDDLIDPNYYAPNPGHAENLYYLGNENEFSPNTVPNSDSYTSSGTGITVSNISGVDSIMTVDIINPN